MKHTDTLDFTAYVIKKNLSRISFNKWSPLKIHILPKAFILNSFVSICGRYL